MSSSATSQKVKDSILELSKMMGAVVRVKCLGGREIEGTLKGYDDLVNLVLDDCTEFVRDPETNIPKNENDTRKLGLVVVRGTQVSLVYPKDGMEEIANPFLAPDDDDDDDDDDRGDGDGDQNE